MITFRSFIALALTPTLLVATLPPADAMIFLRQPHSIDSVFSQQAIPPRLIASIRSAAHPSSSDLAQKASKLLKTPEESTVSPLGHSPKELLAGFVMLDLTLQTQVALGVVFLVLMAPTLWILIFGVPTKLRSYLGMRSNPSPTPPQPAPPLVKTSIQDPFPHLLVKSAAYKAESVKVQASHRAIVDPNIPPQFILHMVRIESVIAKYITPKEQYDVSDQELARTVRDMSLFIQTSNQAADVLLMAPLLPGILSDLELLAPALADELRLALSIAKINSVTSRPSFFDSLIQKNPREYSGYLLNPLMLWSIFGSMTDVHWSLGITLGLLLFSPAWSVAMGIPKWFQPYFPRGVLFQRSWTRQSA